MFYDRPANLIKLGAKLPILLNCHRGKPGPFAKCDSEQNQATLLKELPRTHARTNFFFCKILHKFKRNTDKLKYWHTHYTRVINIKNLRFEKKNVFNYGWTCSSLQNLLLGGSLDLGSEAFGKGNHRCGFCLQLCEMLDVMCFHPNLKEEDKFVSNPWDVDVKSDILGVVVMGVREVGLHPNLMTPAPSLVSKHAPHKTHAFTSCVPPGSCK